MSASSTVPNRDAERITLRFPDVSVHARIETIASHPACRWVKRAPQPFLNLSGRELDRGPPSDGARRSPGWQLDRFRDVHLIWSHFLVLGDEVHKPYFLHPRQSMDWYGGYKWIADKMGVVAEDGEYKLLSSRLSDAVHIDGPVLFAGAEEPDNWGAMLLYTVPAAVHFVNNRPTYRKFFVSINHPNMLALLHLIGLTDEEIINHDYRNKSYYFDELYLFRKEFRDMFVGPTERAAYDHVRTRAEERSRWPAAAKVFISRLQLTREGGKRGLVNELELSERLAALGFRVTEPELLAVEDQIAAFGAARQIVGLGGAGLFGTVFCRPNATLLDIESSTTFLDAHTNLFASCGLNVGVVLGAGDPSDPRGDHRRWSLDLERAMPAISACFDQSAAI
jgi:hypothetical protein